MKARVREMAARMDAALTCTGRLREVTGVEIDDEGREVPTYATRWTGRCLIYPADRDATVVDVGGATTPLARYTVLLPAEVDVRIGHVLDVTASPDAALLVGAIFRIADAPLDAWAAVRHVMAERIESGIWS